MEAARNVEEELKLLKLENEFNRTSVLVYTSGIKLYQQYHELLKDIVHLVQQKEKESNEKSPFKPTASKGQTSSRKKRKTTRNQPHPLVTLTADGCHDNNSRNDSHHSEDYHDDYHHDDNYQGNNYSEEEQYDSSNIKESNSMPTLKSFTLSVSRLHKHKYLTDEDTSTVSLNSSMSDEIELQNNGVTNTTVLSTNGNISLDKGKEKYKGKMVINNSSSLRRSTRKILQNKEDSFIGRKKKRPMCIISDEEGEEKKESGQEYSFIPLSHQPLSSNKKRRSTRNTNKIPLYIYVSSDEEEDEEEEEMIEEDEEMKEKEVKNKNNDKKKTETRKKKLAQPPVNFKRTTRSSKHMKEEEEENRLPMNDDDTCSISEHITQSSSSDESIKVITKKKCFHVLSDDQEEENEQEFKETNNEEEKKEKQEGEEEEVKSKMTRQTRGRKRHKLVLPVNRSRTTRSSKVKTSLAQQHIQMSSSDTESIESDSKIKTKVVCLSSDDEIEKEHKKEERVEKRKTAKQKEKVKDKERANEKDRNKKEDKNKAKDVAKESINEIEKQDNTVYQKETQKKRKQPVRQENTNKSQTASTIVLNAESEHNSQNNEQSKQSEERIIQEEEEKEESIIAETPTQSTVKQQVLSRLSSACYDALKITENKSYKRDLTSELSSASRENPLTSVEINNEEPIGTQIREGETSSKESGKEIHIDTTTGINDNNINRKVENYPVPSSVMKKPKVMPPSKRKTVPTLANQSCISILDITASRLGSVGLKRKTLLNSRLSTASLLYDTFDEQQTKLQHNVGPSIRLNNTNFVAPKLKMSRQEKTLK